MHAVVRAPRGAEGGMILALEIIVYVLVIGVLTFLLGYILPPKL